LDAAGTFQPRSGATSLFIKPPYSIRAIDGLITNFHLPRSTLLMLVAAWLGGERWRAVYHAAKEAGYRFYSYGDATLLW
jgi:S-adenosylmethionine:tRNA ribosyltransferase-isomerase